MTPVAPGIVNDISCKAFQYGGVLCVQSSTGVVLCSTE